MVRWQATFEDFVCSSMWLGRGFLRGLPSLGGLKHEMKKMSGIIAEDGRKFSQIDRKLWWNCRDLKENICPIVARLRIRQNFLCKWKNSAMSFFNFEIIRSLSYRIANQSWAYTTSKSWTILIETSLAMGTYGNRPKAVLAMERNSTLRHARSVLGLSDCRFPLGLGPYFIDFWRIYDCRVGVGLRRSRLARDPR